MRRYQDMFDILRFGRGELWMRVSVSQLPDDARLQSAEDEDMRIAYLDLGPAFHTLLKRARHESLGVLFWG